MTGNCDYSDYHSDYWDDDIWGRDDDPYAAALWSDPTLFKRLPYASLVGGQPTDYELPELAGAWLAELAKPSLFELTMSSGAPLKQLYPHKPVEDPQKGEMYPVRIANHRQTLWIRTDGPRTTQGDRSGYKHIEVYDKPLTTQTAIIALLTVLEAKPIDVEHLRETPSQGPVSYGMGYVRSLLRHYRPDFDYLPHEEKLRLIEEANRRVSSFLKASHQLMEFLEYGDPEHDLRPVVENANRDVQAAVFKDVEGLRFIEIAERFDLHVTRKERDKGDHPRVRQMVKRGRKVLEGVLGKEGWQKQIEAMKADAEEFRNLSSTE